MARISTLSRFTRTLLAATVGTGLAVSGLQAATLTPAPVAFLMPDQSSTRYEEHDLPGFQRQMKTVCAECRVIYQNANGDASRQQQQFNAALAQGAKVIVLDPVDSKAAGSLVRMAHAKGVKVIAYDRPVTSVPVDYYVSFDNEAIGKAIATSLVEHLQAEKVDPKGGGLLVIGGSPTDAAAGLIKKGMLAGLANSGYSILAEYDTPEWAPSKAQQWTSGQITRFGKRILGVVAANDGTAGGAVAAFKAAGVNQVPPITGNDATVAGLQLIIAGDQYNTISKPSEIVASAAADVAGEFLAGKTPKPETTLYDAPSRLFVPNLVTAKNLKAEIIDQKVAGQPIQTAAQLCTDRYAEGCKQLGIQP